MKTYNQISLREGLVLIFVAGLALTGLLSGGITGTLFQLLAFALTATFAITVFVARGRIRSFSIGFVIPTLLYAAALFVAGNPELDPYEGKLPTTALILPLFQNLVRSEYVNVSTGEVVKDFDPAKNPGMGGGGLGMGVIRLREVPDRSTFMPVAHSLLALVFGYAGAKFALFIHDGQSQRSANGE